MKSGIRALHVISGDLWAGAEVQTYNLIGQLQRIPGVAVAAVVLNPGMLSEKLQALDLEVEVVDEARLGAVRILQRLSNFYRRWHPSVIHTHRDKENILGFLANRMADNVPMVRTVHGAEEHAGWLSWRAIRRMGIVAIDRWVTTRSRETVIAVSQALGTVLREIYPAERVVVIENGVDFDAVRAQVAPVDFRLAAPEATHVGLVGRLVPVKRADLFLRTAALLRQSDPDRQWRFHLLGDGPMRGLLEAEAEILKISSSVAFHGHRSDIASCLAGLDVLIICSDHEGLPMTALEAVAVGVPTVAHAVGGLTDVIPREGWVTQHDAKGYRDAVLSALRPDSRLIAERAAQRNRERYSAANNATLTHALYERMLGRREPIDPDPQR